MQLMHLRMEFDSGVGPTCFLKLNHSVPWHLRHISASLQALGKISCLQPFLLKACENLNAYFSLMKERNFLYFMKFNKLKCLVPVNQREERKNESQ